MRFINGEDPQFLVSDGDDRFVESSHVKRSDESFATPHDVNASVVYEPWFPWVTGIGAAALLVIVVLMVLWCCRHRWHRTKLSSPALSGGVPLSPGERGPSAPLFLRLVPPSLRTQTNTVQPPTPLHPADYPMAGGVIGGPVHTNPNPGVALINPQIPSSSGGSGGSTRSRQKGLLESRRGSNTSLTLSLSPSLDSVPGRSASPCRERLDRACLGNAGQLLTREQLRLKVEQEDPTVLFKEFWEIPMNHPSKRDIPLRGIGPKNRYQSIIPNEATRVVLPKINDDPLSTYINANFIRGYRGTEKAFIATQGPMPHTVDDFWRMLWHTAAPVIVMVTNLVEKNKMKCEPYLPPDGGESEIFGPIHVTNLSVEERDGFTVRHLLLRYEEEERPCIHLWYPSWPDHATPATARQLLRLVSACQFFQHTPPPSPADLPPPSTPLPAPSHRQTSLDMDDSRPSNQVPLMSQQPGSCSSAGGPIVVHCSAGLGRTGCFIALCIGCHQLRAEGSVDILGIVSRMRLDRGGLVQTNEQYEFIYKTLASCELERHQTGEENYSPL